MMEKSLITFRPMRKDDIDSVVEIDRFSFSMPWPKSAYIHDLSKNPSALLWVAEKRTPVTGANVVGMIVLWLILDEVHIATLAVHPAHRGNGIGSGLLDIGLIEAYGLGARKAMLEVRASNHTAQSLYKSYGFKVVNRRARYYRDNNEDALLMNLDSLENVVAIKKKVLSQVTNDK
jgi:ribosomal-protein-alanine N-acetyltransferase